MMTNNTTTTAGHLRTAAVAYRAAAITNAADLSALRDALNGLRDYLGSNGRRVDVEAALHAAGMTPDSLPRFSDSRPAGMADVLSYSDRALLVDLRDLEIIDRDDVSPADLAAAPDIRDAARDTVEQFMAGSDVGEWSDVEELRSFCENGDFPGRSRLERRAIIAAAVDLLDDAVERERAAAEDDTDDDTDWDHTARLVAAVATAGSLDALRDALIALGEHAGRADSRMTVDELLSLHGGPSLSNLPVYAQTAPDSTDGIWSWDDRRALVDLGGPLGWAVEPRDDLGATTVREVA